MKTQHKNKKLAVGILISGFLVLFVGSVIAVRAALYINTNVASLEAQKNLGKTQEDLNRSFERLSSGYRINSAADDAAGLGISEEMAAELKKQKSVVDKMYSQIVSVSKMLGNVHLSADQTAQLLEQLYEAQMQAKPSTSNISKILNGLRGVRKKLSIETQKEAKPFMKAIIAAIDDAISMSQSFSMKKLNKANFKEKMSKDISKIHGIDDKAADYAISVNDAAREYIDELDEFLTDIEEDLLEYDGDEDIIYPSPIP